MRTKPRVRSGYSKESRSTSFRCRNCQIRRVKCDGTTPACMKCTSSGRRCPGYSSWLIDVVLPPTPPTEQPESLHEDFQITRKPSLPILNAHVPGESAKHAFDYFRYRICGRYVERGYPTLWARSSIAVGLQYPSVFYAMAALSTMERQSKPIIHTSLARPVDKRKIDFALQMYSQAIIWLREPLQKAIKEDGPLEPIILCCILFVVLEVTAGNTLNAMKHARVGKKILDERLRLSGGPGSASTTSSSSNSPLSSIRALWNETSPDYQIQTPRTPSPPPSLNQAFISLEETKSQLEALIEAGHAVREELILKAREMRQTVSHSPDNAAQFCLTYTFSRTMDITTSIYERLNSIMDGFAKWQRGFRPFLHSGDIISQDLLVMQLRFFYASFTLAMCRARYERLADCFADQFARTLESAARLLRRRTPSAEWYTEDELQGPVATALMRNLSLVETGQPPETEEQSPSTTGLTTTEPSDVVDECPSGIFEFGVLHALFAIACRCRTSYVRHRASQLLSRAKRREGMNSSRTLAGYAKAIIHLEERQAAQSMGQTLEETEYYADEVPEHARFLDVVAYPLPDQPFKFGLVCTRHITDHNDSIELLEYECSDRAGEYRLVNSTRG